MPTDAFSTAQDFAAGRQEPVAVTEAALAVAASEPTTFITLTPERARFEAAQARDRLKRGLPLSPLDGIPVSWKDLVDVAGTRTSIASPLHAEIAPAKADAPAVNLGARAGLVCLGKTNLSELAFSGLGINAHFGTPPGPVARDGSIRIPGGSSSGGASAVARGAGFIAIGSDTAGSIRIPAAYFGLVGYRPSVGRYDMRGVFPLAHSFDAIGPIARSVRDCILADRALRGAPLDMPEPSTPAALRLIVDRALLDAPDLAPAIRRNMERALDALATAGVSIQHRDLAILRQAEAALDTLGWLGAVEGLGVHRATLNDPARRAKIDPRIAARFERAIAMAPDAVAELYRRAADLKAQAAEVLRGALLVLPTVRQTAPDRTKLEADPELFARLNLTSLRNCMLTSFLTLPGVALPTGEDELGLPTSLFLSAAPGDDEALLAAALACEPILRVAG